MKSEKIISTKNSDMSE